MTEIIIPFIGTLTHPVNLGLVQESVKHKRYLLIWTAIELSIIKVSNAIGNWSQILSVTLRALSMPGIAVFMLMFIFMPLLIRHFSGWIKNNRSLPKNCQS